MTPPARSPWRISIPLIVVLLAGLAAIAQAGHEPVPEGGIDHLNVKVGDLAPGETETLEILSLMHGGLRPGWIYMLYGGVNGNHSLDVDLRQGGDVLETWRWPAGTFTTNVTKIQREGVHELAITNPSNETVRYAFYYDQSCNCANKVIPLPGGVALFNNPFPAGHEVQITFPVIADWHLYAALATHDDAKTTAHWPDDFEILAETQAQGPGAGAPGWGWVNFTFETTESRMYYVYLKALAGADDPSDPIHLTPEYQVTALKAERALPVPTAFAMLAALVALAAAHVGKRRTLQ